MPVETYLHHHPVTAAVSKLNFLAGRMALVHHSTFMIAFAIRMGEHKLSYLFACLLTLCFLLLM